MENENPTNTPTTPSMPSGGMPEEGHKLPKNIIILGGLVVVAIVIALVVLFAGGDSADDGATDEDTENVDGSTGIEAQTIEVDVTDDGWSVAGIGAVVGSTVLITNSSSSAIHPSALDEAYEGFDSIRPIEPGDNWEFTFEEVGDFEMYDKLNDQTSITVSIIDPDTL